MLEVPRRIVTANGPDGLSRVASDSLSPHVLESRPNRGLMNLWISDGPPHLDQSVTDGASRPIVLEPPIGGTVFRFFQLAPRSTDGSTSPAKDEAAAQEAFVAMGAAHLRVDTRRHPGMHKSETLDYIILLRGNVRLVLDVGHVDLKPFDVVVQNGTNHAWVNQDPEPALLAGILISAVEPITSPTRRN